MIAGLWKREGETDTEREGGRCGGGGEGEREGVREGGREGGERVGAREEKWKNIYKMNKEVYRDATAKRANTSGVYRDITNVRKSI